MKKYNLIFDCTVLGMGHFHPKAKTGIFRVAENLLKQFVTNPSVDVYFYTQEQPIDTLCYLIEQRIPFTKHQFLVSKRSFNLLELAAKIIVFFPKNSFLRKLFRRLAHYFRPKTDWEVIVKSNENYNFLSPFFPIHYPETLQNKCKKYIIIHDLIPLKFPELVEEGNIEVVRKVIESLDSQTMAVCVSASTQTDLKNYLSSQVQSVVIPLAASKQLFYPIEQQSVIKKTLDKYAILSPEYLLSVATIEPRKNIIRLLQAFILLKKENPNSNLKLVLAGTKGWALEAELHKLLLEENLKNEIQFIGFVDDTDLAALYSGAKAFVYPSLYEGFGLPVLEALQCGTPVLTSSISSLPEVVGNVGIFVNPYEITAIKNGITAILSAEFQNKKAKQQTIEQASQFSWENSMLKYLDIFCQKF